jgi:hypothetical protein
MMPTYSAHTGPNSVSIGSAKGSVAAVNTFGSVGDQHSPRQTEPK